MSFMERVNQGESLVSWPNSELGPEYLVLILLAGGGYSAYKLMGVCRWPLKIGPKKIEEKIEFGAKKINFCKNW